MKAQKLDIRDLRESMKLKSTSKNEILEKNQTSDYVQELPIEKLINKLCQIASLINRFTYYWNTITFFRFCKAICFILYGFYELRISNVVNKEVEWLRIILLYFGGIGQIFWRCLEYIKGRVFITTLYLTYGIYLLSYFCAKKSESLKDDLENFGK